MTWLPVTHQEWMEEELGRHAIDQRGSRIICRYPAACALVFATTICQGTFCSLISITSGCWPACAITPALAPHLQADPQLKSVPLTAADSCCAVRRQGNPLLSGHLLRVSVQAARAIIVVATDTNPDVSDARVLRTVLALMGEHDKLQKRGHLGLKASSLPSRLRPQPVDHQRVGCCVHKAFWLQTPISPQPALECSKPGRGAVEPYAERRATSWRS